MLHENPLNELEKRIVNALLYYEIFSYPLTAEQLFQLAAENESNEDFSIALDSLLNRKYIHQENGYYTTLPNPEWIKQRIENEIRASESMPKALQMGRFIGKFPFVRAVFISGSLSKNVMPEDGDADFFIITHPRRLWLARTILAFYKKIFLLNSRKFFCINYFIDSEHLEIEEQNRFTATEVVTVIPCYGSDFYEPFMQRNQWVKGYYPNFPLRSLQGVPPNTIGGMKYIFEKTLSLRIGSWLNAFGRSLTVRFWHLKFKNLSNQDFSVALKSSDYVSKHHPRHFQKKVLGKFEEKKAIFEKMNGVGL